MVAWQAARKEATQQFEAEHATVLRQYEAARREIAEHYAKGGILAQLDGDMRRTFEDLAERLERMSREDAEVSHA